MRIPPTHEGVPRISSVTTHDASDNALGSSFVREAAIAPVPSRSRSVDVAEGD
jgi:hypothetical protein